MKVAIVIVLAAGCFTKPDRPNVAADAHASADAASPDAPSGLTPRLISSGYWSGLGSSIDMTATGFAVSTDGIVDGDLVLFIASIDNGPSNGTIWPSFDNFTQLVQKEYGNDTQTFVVASKIANHEPMAYAGTYTDTTGSGRAAVSLIAISGADPHTPINASHANFETGTSSMMVVGMSPGITTTTANCTLIYASGADWEGFGGTNTTQPPDNFSLLTTIGDGGDGDATLVSWEWTSQQVAYSKSVPIGATGAITGSLTGTRKALAWTVLIAVAPAP